MLIAPRRLLGAAAGLMLLAPLAPATATASAPHRTHHPAPVHRMTHGQAIAALHRARGLTDGHSDEAAAPGRGVDATPVFRDLALALPSLDGPERSTASRLLARPTDEGGDDLGSDAVVQLDPTRVTTVDDPDGHFSVHYIAGTPDPAHRLDDSSSTTWVNDNVLPALDRAWSTEVDTLGYHAPLADTGDGTKGNPDDKLDVYLANLGQYGLYGYCTTADPVPATLTDPAYCVIDNDFAEFGAHPLDAMHATVAHEFFHAVQFSYDLGEDLWFMEGTAAWMEHQVYPGSRDYLQYLDGTALAHPYYPVDLADGYDEYGAFLFWQYVSERLGQKAVRDVWTNAAATNTGNRYSLQALRGIVSAHRQNFTSFFATFARWNTLPPHSYSLRSAYAARTKPRWGLVHTFSRAHPRLSARQTELLHLSSSNVLFRPSAKLGRRARLHVSLNLPNRSHGPAASVGVRHRNGSVSWRWVRLRRNGAGAATVSFNPRKVRGVLLVLSNTSSAMHGCGTATDNWYVYSCLGTGVYDNNQVYRISARLR